MVYLPISDIPSTHSHTLPHTVGHATHQVIQCLRTDAEPRSLEVPDERLLGGSQLHNAELAVHDSPQVLDGRQVRAVARLYILLLKPWEVVPAPLLSAGGVMSWSAVLLEDRLGHPREQLDMCWRPRLLLPLHRRRCRLLQDLLHVVLGRHGLAAGTMWSSDRP